MRTLRRHSRKNGNLSIWRVGRFRIKSGMTSVFLVVLLLTGCAAESVEPLPEITYTSNLGPAVCYATEQVNRAGLLQDEAAFGPAFTAAIGEYLEQHNLDPAAWLAAKEAYFTPEEYKKLVKFHFTRCIVGL